MEDNSGTACPRSSYPFYKVSYYVRWVTTSYTYSISNTNLKKVTSLITAPYKLSNSEVRPSMCPKSLDPFNIYIKWVKTSWTYYMSKK